MQVFVTGHLGLVGKRIVGALEREGHVVIGYDKAGDPADDIADKDRMVRRMKGCLSVIHLAAIPGPRGNPWEEYKTENVDGTKNVLDAAVEADIKSFVYCSTGCVYGLEMLEDIPGCLKENDRFPLDEVGPQAHYSRSKIMAETMVEERAGDFSEGAWSLRVDGLEERGIGLHNGWQCPWVTLEEAFVKAATETKAPTPFVAVNVGYSTKEGRVEFTRQRELLGIEVTA